jgi:hypothetical protein
MSYQSTEGEHLMIHSQKVEVRVITPGESEQSGRAYLHYDGDDPFAVQFVFPVLTQTGRIEDNVWAFARTLIEDAMESPGVKGIGDLQVLRDGDVFTFFLVAPEGMAAVKVEAIEVIHFLGETYEIIPMAEENIGNALDAFLADLLAIGE